MSATPFQKYASNRRRKRGKRRERIAQRDADVQRYRMEAPAVRARKAHLFAELRVELDVRLLATQKPRRAIAAGA